MLQKQQTEDEYKRKRDQMIKAQLLERERFQREREELALISADEKYLRKKKIVSEVDKLKILKARSLRYQ